MTASIVSASPIVRAPFPAMPAAPEEVVRAASQPMVRFNYSGTEVAEWNEGSWPFSRDTFTSHRGVSFGHEFQAAAMRGDSKELLYASRDYEGALLIAKHQVSRHNTAIGSYHPWFGSAVLQAADGAYFVVPVLDINPDIDRDSDILEVNKVDPAVRVLDLRSSTPWSAPEGRSDATASQAPKDVDAVRTHRVRDIKMESVERRTPLLQAIVNADRMVYDLRGAAVH